MSHAYDKAPVLRTATSEASPAQESLRSTLGATDTGLSLNKKKSWFSSLRDAVQKSALQAKATIDGLRGDGSSTETGMKEEIVPRQSNDSTRSAPATPLKSHPARRHTVMSRTAVSSLRHHLTRSSTKRRPRGSVFAIASRPSSELAGLAGPEEYVSRCQPDGDSIDHKRRISIADSLAGSIRGFGRKIGNVRPLSPPPKSSCQPEEPAEGLPLPSSPIDIPSAAPALELDLGPAGFMSPTFTRTQETLMLTDPAHTTIGMPESYNVHVPEHVNYEYSKKSRNNSVTPSDLLRVPTEHLEADPASPMPGTSFALELDGAEQDNKSEVFERNVTPPNEKERKELRTMRSIDALAEASTTAHAADEDFTEAVEQTLTPRLAEACTIAHANDDAMRAAPPVHILSNDQVDGTTETDVKPLGVPKVERRDITSASTVSICPSDMPQLTRQEHGYSDNWIHSQKLNQILDGTSESPFEEHNVATTGPPSPIRRVNLPFRPKVTDDVLKATAAFVKGERSPFGSEESDAPADTWYTTSSVTTSVLATEPESAEPEPKQSYSSKGLPNLQREADVFAGSARFDAWQPTLSPSEDAAEPDTAASEVGEDDTQPNIQGIVAIDRLLHGMSFDSASESHNSGGSPHTGPLVPQLYSSIQSNDDASPRSVRSRTTYTAGLGDAEHRFTFENWLRDPSPSKGSKTPNRRTMDMSLDSVDSANERQPPAASPHASSNADRTPSMGNKLDFDLKRSQRNMRYNALNQENKDNVQDSASPLARQDSCSGLTGTAGVALHQLPSGRPRLYTGPVTENIPDSLMDDVAFASELEQRLRDPQIGDAATAPPATDSLADDKIFMLDSLEDSPGASEMEWLDSPNSVQGYSSQERRPFSCSDEDGLTSEEIGNDEIERFSPTEPKSGNAWVNQYDALGDLDESLDRYERSPTHADSESPQKGSKRIPSRYRSPRRCPAQVVRDLTKDET